MGACCGKEPEPTPPPAAMMHRKRESLAGQGGIKPDDVKVDLEKLTAFIGTRSVNVTDTIIDPSSRRRKLTWDEDSDELWGGDSPTIEIYYDCTYGFLLSVYFQIDTKKSTLREKGLMRVFMKLLQDQGCGCI